MSQRLFIASVGNPGNLANTRHSAGHHLLEGLRRRLDYPHFAPYISEGPLHALFRSPEFMNKSGKPIVSAFKKFVAKHGDAKLVVLFDEMEITPGKVKLKMSGSVKGHNGLKSVKDALGGKDFTRIGYGIGRPEGRDSDTVSAYVLQRLTQYEKQAIEEASSQVLEMIEKLEE